MFDNEFVDICFNLSSVLCATEMEMSKTIDQNIFLNVKSCIHKFFVLRFCLFIGDIWSCALNGVNG